MGSYLLPSYLGVLDFDLDLPEPSFVVFSYLLAMDYLDDLFYGGWWELNGGQSV